MRKRHRSILRGILIVLLLIWTLFPIYWMVSLSVRDQSELMGDKPFWPQSFSLSHFQELFEKSDFPRAVGNSLEVTLISTAAALLFGLMCAYVLARTRFHFRFRGPALVWSFLVRILPPIAFALPLYIMMNAADLLNTKIPVILAHILMNLPFVIWFMMVSFEGMPEEIEESARIDGASEGKIFWSIVLPVSAPGIAAVSILSFMTSWNEYLYGVIFVQRPQNFTIPISLSTFNSEQELTHWGALMAGGVVSMLPIVLFVIFTQRFLIQGLSGGAVKE